MTLVVLDTNVIVQSLISDRGASKAVLDAFFDGRFETVFAPSTLEELRAALLIDSIRQRHGLTDNEVDEFLASLIVNSVLYEDELSSPFVRPKDVADWKFVALCEALAPDYLVTNDGRHLGKLKSIGETAVVTPAAFIRRLAKADGGAP